MKLTSEAQVHCEATRRSQDAVKERLEYLNQGQKSYLPADFHSPVEKVEDPFDLENLRYREPVYDETRNKQILVTPDLVKSFVEEINKLPDAGPPFTIGIGTGGTPSMDKQDTGGALETKFNFEGLMNHPKINPALKKEFEVLGIDLFKTDSSQLLVDDVGDMTIAMSYIWENMRPALKRRFSGFIVIHGTDTMSKSGAHHATMLGKGMPFNVVHVGAQRSINETNTDFPTNLEDAFRTLDILNRSKLAECVTVMGRKALLTIGTNKVSGQKLEAMMSPRHMDMLDFRKPFDPKTFTIRQDGRYREKDSGVPFEPVVYRGPNRVRTMHAEMDEDPTFIMSVIRQSAAKAILIVPYQSGTYDAQSIEWMDRFAKRYQHTAAAEHEVGPARPHDIPIFAVHPADEFTDLQRYDAALEQLRRAGVVALNMTASAARAKITRALAISSEEDLDYKHQLIANVTENFIGETSYTGLRYLDRFDPVDVHDIEQISNNKVGSESTAKLFAGGNSAYTQIRAMRETDFRGDNLNNIVNPELRFLLANTTFWRELLEEINITQSSLSKLDRRTAVGADPDPTMLAKIYKQLNERWLPVIVAVLNDPEAAKEFMRAHRIEENIMNFIQLRDEMLFVWSQLTDNNLTFTRNGASPGGSEKYAPLVGPDANGTIRRIDHGKRLEDTVLSFLS